MEKRRQILEPVIFLILTAAGIWLVEVVDRQCSLTYQMSPIIILAPIFYFLVGVFLNCVNRKINFHARCFSPFHLAMLILFLLLAVFLFEFNDYMPQFISHNTNMAEFLLLSYAGANLPSAFFDR